MTINWVHRISLSLILLLVKLSCESAIAEEFDVGKFEKDFHSADFKTKSTMVKKLSQEKSIKPKQYQDLFALFSKELKKRPPIEGEFKGLSEKDQDFVKMQASMVILAYSQFKLNGLKEATPFLDKIRKSSPNSHAYKIIKYLDDLEKKKAEEKQFRQELAKLEKQLKAVPNGDLVDKYIQAIPTEKEKKAYRTAVITEIGKRSLDFKITDLKKRNQIIVIIKKHIFNEKNYHMQIILARSMRVLDNYDETFKNFLLTLVKDTNCPPKLAHILKQQFPHHLHKFSSKK